MLRKILNFRTALMFLLSLSFICPGVFAQGHQDGRNGGNSGTIHRGSGAYSRNNGHRHYYHNGNWNRSGWYGWGVQAPIMTDGVLVSSLPPGYTTVVVSGNPYFYGNGMYFRQTSSGAFAVVTLVN